MVSISAMCGVLIHSTKLKSSTKFIRGAKSTSAELISVSTLSLGLSHTPGGGGTAIYGLYRYVPL